MTDWIKTAEAGDRVVCVDDDITRLGGARQLVFGAVYIIRAVGPFVSANGEPYMGIFVEGIERPWKGVDYPFYADRFRPVHPRKTDISIFEKLLQSAPADQPVKEPAPC